MSLAVVLFEVDVNGGFLFVGGLISQLHYEDLSAFGVILESVGITFIELGHEERYLVPAGALFRYQGLVFPFGPPGIVSFRQVVSNVNVFLAVGDLHNDVFLRIGVATVAVYDSHQGGSKGDIQQRIDPE